MTTGRKMQMTYELANACALDAGNASMRRAERKAWTLDDWNVMAKKFHRLWPCPPGANCPTCYPQETESCP